MNLTQLLSWHNPAPGHLSVRPDAGLPRKANQLPCAAKFSTYRRGARSPPLRKLRCTASSAMRSSAWDKAAKQRAALQHKSCRRVWSGLGRPAGGWVMIRFVLRTESRRFPARAAANRCRGALFAAILLLVIPAS